MRGKTYTHFFSRFTQERGLDRIRARNEEPFTGNAPGRPVLVLSIKALDSFPEQRYLKEILCSIVCRHCRKPKRPQAEKYLSTYIAEFELWAQAVQEKQHTSTRSSSWLVEWKVREKTKLIGNKIPALD